MKERHFTVHPDVVAWIESDLPDWLDGLAAELAAGYTPRPSKFAAVPKAGGLIRPGTILDLDDALVYNLLVGRLLHSIIHQLRWSQGTVDTAYPLAPTADAADWTGTGFLVWRSWRDQSIARLSAPGVEYVVVSDITGFYENVDLQRLTWEQNLLNAVEDGTPCNAFNFPRTSSTRLNGPCFGNSPP